MTKHHTKTDQRVGASDAPTRFFLHHMPHFDALLQTPAGKYVSSICAQHIQTCARDFRLDEAYIKLACVVRLDRTKPLAVWQDGFDQIEFSAKMAKAKNSLAIGDWVLVYAPPRQKTPVCIYRFEPICELARWKGTKRGTQQTLASNIDYLLIAQALDKSHFSFDRIIRSVIVAKDCHIEPIVILTKADCISEEQITEIQNELHDVLGSALKLFVTSCKTGYEATLVPLVEFLREAKVFFLFGESGAGKSTLVNTLMHESVAQTGSVRERDKAGRHTTVARQMLSFSEGGFIIDAPGIRSLALMGHEKGLSLVFPEIEQAACACRFRDCTHNHEPGCAVRELAQDNAHIQHQLDYYKALALEIQQNNASLDFDVKR